MKILENVGVLNLIITGIPSILLFPKVIGDKICKF